MRNEIIYKLIQIAFFTKGKKGFGFFFVHENNTFSLIQKNNNIETLEEEIKNQLNLYYPEINTVTILVFIISHRFFFNPCAHKGERSLCLPTYLFIYLIMGKILISWQLFPLTNKRCIYFHFTKLWQCMDIKEYIVPS